MIVVLKRKAELCNEIGLYDDVIPATQRMLDLLDDYEKRPLYYHDGTYREPDDDDRPGYIDFYRGKTYAYIAIAKANLGFREESLDYLKLYEQTAAGQSVTGRFLPISATSSSKRNCFSTPTLSARRSSNAPVCRKNASVPLLPKAVTMSYLPRSSASFALIMPYD